jgi:hypothetical protein
MRAAAVQEFAVLVHHGHHVRHVVGDLFEEVQARLELDLGLAQGFDALLQHGDLRSQLFRFHMDPIVPVALVCHRLAPPWLTRRVSPAPLCLRPFINILWK